MVRVSRSTPLLATAIAVTIALSSCSPTTPLVPESLVTSIAEDGREYTYDVAWQNTRLVADIIEREAFHDLEDVALQLAARLHRLERARAENMSDRATARTLSRFEEQVSRRNLSENMEALRNSANKALEIFDEGDFSTAKNYSLEVLVIARWLSDQQ